MKRHIALLLTNTDKSALAQRHPNDGEKVAARLGKIRPDWTFRIHAVRDGEFPDDVSGIDGVVITGSKASVNDGLPWIAQAQAFVRSLHVQRVPTVGLCFGHQLIAKALGGTVSRAADWGLGVGRVAITDPQDWMTPRQDGLTLFAAHQDQVTALPAGARLLGGDDFCPVGLYVVGDAQGDHMLATQYHPELSRDFMRDLLGHIDGQMPEGVVPRARPQVELPVDADLFFEWMARFIEMPRRAVP